MSSKFKKWVLANRWPLALAGATLATRVVYLVTVSHDPFFTYLRHIPDAFFFNNWAQEIVSGDWKGGDTVFFIGPLYAYFLAIIYRLTGGPHLVIVRYVHIALEVGSVLFLYGFARRVFGERPAKVTGIIWVLYLPAIFFSSFVLPVSLDIFLIAGSFYLVARGVEGRWWNFAGAGALLGLAALDRTNLLVFALAAVPVFLIYIKRLGWKRLAAYFVPVAAIVFAATLRNGLVGGDFVLVSSQGGLNFYLGNSEGATGVYWNLGEIYQGRPAELNRDLATLVAEDLEGREMKPSEVQRWWLRNGLLWLRDRPGDAAKLYWRKFRFLTTDYEVSLNVDFYFMKFISFFHRIQVPWYGFVFPFGVIGLVLGWRRSTFARTLGAVFVVAYALSVLVFFISARYRLPIVPMLIVFAGAGLVRWYDLWRAWRWRAAAVMTAVAMALGLFSAWYIEGTGRTIAFGQSYYRYGKYYFDEGDYREAIPYFRRSTATTPEMYQAFLMLGISYEKLGQRDTALDTFFRGTLAAPQVPQMHFNFGVALGRAGQLRESIAPLSRAVELDRNYVEAWAQLGEVFIGVGDYVRAEVAYSRAVELAPDHAPYLLRYAGLMYASRRYDEALAFAGRAMEADPDLPGPGIIIGRLLYESGDYDAALEYFKRESELQPRSAEVYAFLTLLNMRVGDVESARAAYQNYLSLGGAPDPNFERDAGLSTE